MTSSKIILFFTLLFLGINSKGIEKRNFYNLSIENGLYHSGVKEIVQDRFGFIWIATSEGLQRFDGQNFKYYGISENTNDLINNNIYKLYISNKQDLLFVFCSGRALSILDLKSGCFQHVYANEFNTENLNVSGITYIYDNAYLISLLGFGKLYCFNIETMKADGINLKLNEEKISSLDGSINNIYIDDSNILWLVTSSGLYKSNKLDLNKKLTEISLKKVENIENVKSIVEFDKSNCSVVTKSKIYLLNRFTNEIKDITPNELKGLDFVEHVKSDKGDIWIGTTNSGLIKFNIEKNELLIYKHDPIQKKSIINNKITDVFYSKRDSTLWVGTNKGMSYLNTGNESFKYYNPITINKEIIDVNFGYFIGSDSSVWIYSSSGIYYTEKDLEKFVKVDKTNKNYSFLSNTRLGSIYEDKDNIIWFATDKGLYAYNLNSGIKNLYSIKNNENNKFLNKMVKIFPAGDSLWIATRGGIILFNKHHKEFTIYNLPKDINLSEKGLNVSDIIYSKQQNEIWLGVNTVGVYKYSLGTNKYQFYCRNENNKNSLSENNVISILLDSDNDIWISTYTGGVNKYIPEIDGFEKYTLDNVLPSNSVYAMLEDDYSNIWMSTNRGIVRLNKKTKESNVFTYYDGLYIHEFNMNSYYKATDGKMHFGGIGGVVSFYPKDVLKKTQIPDIYLTDIYIQNKKIEPDSKILNGKTLIHQEKISMKYIKATISFDVALIEYIFPNRTHFAWMLSNYETEWNYSRHGQSNITYANLPPGNYELLIKSTSDNINWSKEQYSLLIEIVPPWWKTLWLRALIVVVVFVSIFGFYNLRIFYLKKQKVLLNRQVEEKTIELQELNEDLKESNAEINTQNEELQRHRNYLEELVDERTIQLKLALQKAKESLEFKNAILKNISHEIRTPLNAIVGYSQLLGENRTDNNDNMFIEYIIDSSNSLIDVIENVIEISILEADKKQIKEEEFDIYEELNKLLDDLKYKINKKVKLVVDFNIDINKIYSDKMYFRKILKQIINNAIKYTDEGSIVVKLEIKNKDEIIQVINNNTLKFDKYLLVEVKDTGIGIPSDQNEKIYETFRKVEDYNGRLFRGVGLGLSISKHLVENLGGIIWHKSNIPHGTIFNIVIPIKHK